MIARRLVALVVLAAVLLSACTADRPDSVEVPLTEQTNADVRRSTIQASESVEPTPTPTSPQPTQTPTRQPLEPTTSAPTMTSTPPTASPVAATGLLRLVDFLDDPQGYCVDVDGFGANLRLDAPLQAHTCKPRSDDQLFSPLDGNGIRLERHGRCLSAPSRVPGARVGVAPCDANAATQDFHLGDDGRLRLPSEDATALCLGVADGVGEPAGGRNHLRRDLIQYDCGQVDASLIVWELVKQ